MGTIRGTKHDIDSTDKHAGVSGATEDNVASFDANGLPKDSGKTTAEIAANTAHTAGDGSDHSDVALNNTHRTSDGSDHSNIDQDVTSGSSPTFDGANITGVDASNVDIAKIGSATYGSVQKYIDGTGSAGLITGGVLSDGGSQTVAYTASKGFLRTDSPIGDVVAFDLASGATSAIPTDTIRYIGIEYNAGAPQITVRTTLNFNRHTDFLLGTAVNEGGTLHILNNGQVIVDHAEEAYERMYFTAPYERGNRSGGGIIGETGTRNITMSAVEFFDGLNEFEVSAIDTSGADTYDLYYRDGVGGWTKVSAQTQWPNAQYDDGSGTLAGLTNNRYSFIDFYIEMDGDLVGLYGQSQHTSNSEAEQAGTSATVPNRVTAHGKFIGRITFQKSASVASSVLSVFTDDLTPTAVSDHGGLAGLADDDHSQYSLVSSQGGAPSSTPTRVGEINIDTTEDSVYVSTDTASSADWDKISNTGAKKGTITVTFDGGGAALTTGAKKVYRQVPFAGTITAATLLADQSGSIVIDVWKDTYANFPPTVADTITASAKPTLSTAQKSTDSTLTGWTTSVAAGDILEFNIDSITTITKCILTLDIDKTGV